MFKVATFTSAKHCSYGFTLGGLCLCEQMCRGVCVWGLFLSLSHYHSRSFDFDCQSDGYAAFIDVSKSVSLLYVFLWICVYSPSLI